MPALSHEDGGGGAGLDAGGETMSGDGKLVDAGFGFGTLRQCVAGDKEHGGWIEGRVGEKGDQIIGAGGADGLPGAEDGKRAERWLHPFHWTGGAAHRGYAH